MSQDRPGDQPIFGRDITPESARARMVQEVLREQEAKDAVRHPPAGPPGTTTFRIGATALVAIVALWLWLLPPAWIEFTAPPPLPVQVEEAGLRMAIYLQAQRIERFRRERGRLPDVLAEAGEPLSGVSYDRLDAGTFRLTGAGANMELTYHSADSIAAFVAPLLEPSGDGS